MNHNDKRSSETLRALLEELYVMDPAMRDHEDIIRKILVEFLATSPSIKLDPTFVTHLRTRITERAYELTHERTPNHSSFWNVLAVYHLPLGSALLVVLLTLPFAYSRFGGSSSPTIPLFTNQIATLEKNAFGTLTPGSPSQGVSPQRSTLGMGGGSSTESAPSGMQKDTARIMPYPLPPDQVVHYKFNYNGDPITLEESELPVYRTRKDTGSGKTFFDLVRSTSIGSFALDKLQNAFVHNITISEDRPRGYTLYLNFENQSLSMNMNWSSWPHLMRPQDSNAQTPPPSLSDGEITGIIEAFAREYNISTTVR